MRILFLTPVLVVSALSLFACGKSDQAPRQEPSAAAVPAGSPTNASQSGSNESCLTESPVDETYESVKATVKNENKWIRDASKLVVTTIAPVQFDAGTRDEGSGREIGFEDGVSVDLTNIDGVQPKAGSSICKLAVQYSNKDFFAMLDAVKKGSQHPYPVLVLPPGTLRATQWSVVESTGWAPKSRQPQNQCPALAISKSSYRFTVDPRVALRYPNGKKSESTVVSIDCEGFNQKGSSIVKALGRNKVGAVEL